MGGSIMGRMDTPLLALLASLASSDNVAPCCSSCGGNTVKYWALDTPNNECAETCLDPSDKLKTAEFAIITGFKGSKAGDEASPCQHAHFSAYNRTDTIGAGPAKLVLDKYLPDAVAPFTDGNSGEFIVADMHDGDQKAISISEEQCFPGPCSPGSDGVSIMTIKPHANNQTWVVQVELHSSTNDVSGVVDFNVPGKPGAPPCNLTVTLMTEYGGSSGKFGHGKRTLEFTDPTGTITKDPTFPLNTWVELVH